MSITSLLFLALVFVAAMVYHKLPAKLRNLWLLAISAGFLATWSWQFIIILLIFGLINFGLGIMIERPGTNKKAWVVFGVIVNLVILFVFKYNHFYQPALLHLLERMGIKGISDGLKILLPVGLSFLTVQAISYLVDVSNVRLKAERNLVKFWVYVVYFPKLLSGPVERAKNFLPQLDAPLHFDKPLFERSLVLILTGLFRKLFIADSLFRMIPENAFTTPQSYAGQHLVFWLLGYAFALYNDFAGYTAIVRGISLWFGIELSNNFNLPYLSHNFTEFWNRWHISLSSWLRDYIFFPTSRALMKRFPERTNVFALAIPPLATLLASGMWHGLSWNLLVWGGLHGCYLLGERVIGLIKRPVPLNEQSRWQKALGLVTTFILAVLAWIPFRMSLPVAWSYFTGMFKWILPSRSLILAYLKGTSNVVAWSPLNLPNPLLLLLIGLAIGFDLLMNKGGNERDLRSFATKWQVVILSAMLLLILVSLFADTVAPFVYQAY
jgi:D-alanyl-lipoteichoic acid acyltransferase DltB (MBOAT superfamily)